MVETAEKKADSGNPEKTPEAEVAELEVDESQDGNEEEGAEDSTDDSQEDSGEVDIIREGDTQPQQNETPAWLSKRIGKLNKKVDSANEETDGERTLRVKAEEERDLYKARLAQVEPQAQPLTPPDPSTFDGGHLDPDYVTALGDFTKKTIKAEVAQGMDKATQQSTVTAAEKVEAQALEKAQTAHYDRAAKLKVKDYPETEDKTIEIFGKDHVNHLIRNLDDSEIAFYYFGKNPEVAQKHADKLNKEPIRALIEIGRLVSEIKIRPKNEPAPDPDLELEGGTPSNMEAMQNKLNKLREAARSGKGMDKVLAFKKQMKAKGIKLR